MYDQRTVCAHCGFEVTQEDEQCQLCDESVNAVTAQKSG